MGYRGNPVYLYNARPLDGNKHSIGREEYVSKTQEQEDIERLQELYKKAREVMKQDQARVDVLEDQVSKINRALNMDFFGESGEIHSIHDYCNYLHNKMNEFAQTAPSSSHQVKGKRGYNVTIRAGNQVVEIKRQ